MIRREDIRYDNFWVRLVCCVAVAVAVANAVHFRLLDAWETLARELLLSSASDAFARPGAFVRIAVIFAACLPPSFLRIERPLAMTLFAFVLTALYASVVLAAGLIAELALPAASPLLGIVGSTTFLGAMAWSEERMKRRKLELLEIAKRQFTDMLVHDLRKRMSSILTSFSVIETALDKTESRTRELIDTVRASAQRMVMQIDDLLSIRRMEEGALRLNRERLSLDTVLRESVEEHRAAAAVAGARVVLKPVPDTALYADRDVVARVLANLLWNALQHARAGTDIEVGGAGGADGVSFYVANRGEPIPAGRRASLFLGFASRREPGAGEGGGTGLGLTFCRLAAEAHGGDIRIESPWEEQGDGVKATVRLPAGPAGHR